MRFLIILLVVTGIGLTAWLSLGGTSTRPGGMKDGEAPRIWWTDALGSLTSPFANAVDMASQTFDLSRQAATVRIPPGKGPRIARFKLEAGPYPVPILFKDVTLYLLPETGEVQIPPCVSPNCVASRGKVTLSAPDEGGDVTIKQTPGGRVILIP